MTGRLEELSLGAAPAEEECEQVGAGYDRARARAECVAYRDQLLRERGTPPRGARLVIKTCPHDFGTYLDLVVTFEDVDEGSVAGTYAWGCEEHAPARWDAEARAALGLPPVGGTT